MAFGVRAALKVDPATALGGQTMDRRVMVDIKRVAKHYGVGEGEARPPASLP